MNPKCGPQYSFECTTTGTVYPEPDVAGSRKRLQKRSFQFSAPGELHHVTNRLSFHFVFYLSTLLIAFTFIFDLQLTALSLDFAFTQFAETF